MTVISKVSGTLANLKGTEATLRLYSIQEQNEDSKRAYKEALEITEEVIKDLENRIKTLEFEEPQYKES